MILVSENLCEKFVTTDYGIGSISGHAQGKHICG
jgi:hypothetical protein